METNLITARMDLVAQIAVSLLSISITLIALVPVLIEVVRARITNFLTSKDEQNSLKLALGGLATSLIFFGIDLLIWFIGNLFISAILYYLMLAILLIGVCFLTYACFFISKTCIKAI